MRPKKPADMSKRIFQRHARVVTETGGHGRIVGFHTHGEYRVLIDGTDIAMRYHFTDLRAEDVIAVREDA